MFLPTPCIQRKTAQQLQWRHADASGRTLALARMLLAAGVVAALGELERLTDSVASTRSKVETSKLRTVVTQVAAFAATPLFAGIMLSSGALPTILRTVEAISACSGLPDAERVLVADGRVVISGFNPTSLWALRLARQHLWRLLGLGRFMQADYLPLPNGFLGIWRLRDWLRLLGFEVELVRYGCYAPAVESSAWLQRFGWLDRLGARWWPVLGAAYMLVAVKKVRGARLLGAARKAAPVRAATTVVAGQSRQDMVKKDGEQ